MAKKEQAQFVRVALVLPTEYAYARDVLRGIIAATRERNLFSKPAGSREAVTPWLFRVYRGIYGHSSKYLEKWFGEWNPDGIICQIYDDRLAKVYRATRKPVVELFANRSSSEFPRIVPDDAAVGRMAARHFLERGFRHFAYFGVPWMNWSRERERGFQDEVEREFAARAATATRRNAAQSTYTFASYGNNTGRQKGGIEASTDRNKGAAGAWLASLPRPLAVFVANDTWGFQIVQDARESGLHVPDQLAVLGVDNEDLLCEIAHPPLSSIRFGAEQVGHASVALMEELLGGASREPRDVRVPPSEVVTRQSTDVLAVEDEDVVEALRYIRAHAAAGLSVKQLLKVVSVNRRTLERRFVGVLGHTPLEEINRVRLERVKVLLQTSLPIGEVAARSGFATPEYMATSFLRATGQTPTAFRRHHAPRFGPRRLQSLE
jgi:LacI family transcriptional regulator